MEFELQKHKSWNTYEIRGIESWLAKFCLNHGNPITELLGKKQGPGYYY
jgi:hypothetical protein